MDKETRELIVKIEVARNWAREHFNVAACNDTRLVDDKLNILPPSFFVEFPTSDTMRVTPSIMGNPHGLWFEYRLAFRRDGTMVWRGKHPIFGTPIPGLIVNVFAPNRR